MLVLETWPHTIFMQNKLLPVLVLSFSLSFVLNTRGCSLNLRFGTATFHLFGGMSGYRPLKIILYLTFLCTSYSLDKFFTVSF